MQKIVGVMGPGSKDASSDDLSCAYEVGKLVAESGATLLCGGMGGVMEQCAKGAQEKKGLTVGLGSTQHKEDLNGYIDVPLVTGMGPGRNFMNVICSDVLVFVSIGSPGTLSELAFALQMKKPIVIIRGTPELQNYIGTITTEVIFVDEVSQIKDFLFNALA